MLQRYGHLAIRIAESRDDIIAAQRLRYRVFVEELGGNGAGVDHDARLETDPLDAFCRHLVLVDTRRDPAGHNHVVGTYRMLTAPEAQAAGGFYCESEYDLTPLKASGRPLLELGRSCVDPELRRGPAMFLLWSALAGICHSEGIEVLFGVASFHGTDVHRVAAPLTLLHREHLAPPAMRVSVLPEHFQSMDLVAPEHLDPVAAMKAVPALIKAYLRLGGYVGEGAFVDHAFNTIDVCLVLDTKRLKAGQSRLLDRMRGG